MFFIAYFESARYGNDDGVVHAEVDVAVMQTVAESASDEEVESFRGGFKNIFVRNNPYVMNEKDSRLEWKAFVVFLSLSCIDLYNKYGDEAIDIVPFLKVCLNSLYFKSSTQALGLIYFGFARNAVSSKLKILDGKH